MRTYQRSILRWAGSKKRLLPKLMSCIPQSFNSYFEPFAGSACLFFALEPRRATLGDINPALVEAYAVLRAHPIEVYEAISAMPDTEAYYYRIRKFEPSLLAETERAARFIYLNRFCFNGVYRTNVRGEFNVPRGLSTGRIPSREEFLRCASLLQDCTLHAGDFSLSVASAGAGDFVYLDPPYTTSSRPAYGEYGYGSFSSKDFERLAKVAVHLADQGAVVLLSYSEAALSGHHFNDWHCRTVSVKRHVAGFSRHRAIVSEVLLCNHPIPE
jgi:DNA adenine methylase